MIVGVAVRCADGSVLSLPRPARHANLLDKYNESARADGWDFPWSGWPSERVRDGEQGFIDDRGVFLTREEAAVAARLCGQIPAFKLTHPQEELFSEDVW